ncbi:hypothetical protein GGR21_000498 [Dysgonomonas hofstadii]|uniref:Uncharacterized protein n=1 Tax=Dysgonomonas hofstadii TaxID=637886 RepID=A0A840CHB2_9BACT|nr:hypothetical protein [Dysgonomonas hofstadii]
MLYLLYLCMINQVNRDIEIFRNIKNTKFLALNDTNTLNFHFTDRWTLS